LHSRISIHEVPVVRGDDVEMDNFDRIMNNNAIWAEEILKKEATFFDKLKDIQTPEYLWIGCSDSRVPAN
jgi:carbonic anhydrase